MTATSGPFACCQPSFVASQPITGPGDNGIGDETIRRPLRRCRIVHAQGRSLRAIVAPINMRDRVTCDRMCHLQHRLDQGHFRRIAIDDFEVPEPVSAYILDFHDMDGVQRPQGTCPGAPPAAMFGVPQIGKPIAHPRDLICHCQPWHSHGRPKKECRGVATALAGAAAVKTRPLPGRCMLRPAWIFLPSRRV